MITFGSDVADLILQRTLGENTLGLNNSINRMTTGYKVNHAKDNAAGYSIITDLSKKISSMLQVQQNTEDGIALLQTAEGGLEEIQKLLERLRDLATQASNGTYDADAREAMQAEADEILEQIEQIRNVTSYNGKNLFETEQNSNTPVSRLSNSVRSASPSALMSSRVMSISDEDTVSGAFDFSSGETKTVTIDGVSYTVTNNASVSASLSYTKDKSTGVLTISANKMTIKGEADVAHNLVINGSSNNVYGGDKNDSLALANAVNRDNRLYGGAGDDTFTNVASTVHNLFYGDAGNDTFNLYGLATVWAGDGDDIININYSCPLGSNLNAHGGSGDDIFNINASNWCCYGNSEEDTFNIKSGVQNTFVDGGGGTNAINDNGTNTTKINVPNANAYSEAFAIGATKTLTINGKEYTITNTASYVQNLVYSINGDTIEFQGTDFKITGNSEQSHNVKLLSQRMTFIGGNLKDTIIVADTARYATIYGGSGDDYIENNANDVYMWGQDGNDTIINNGGNSCLIFGGNGDDTVEIAKGTGHYLDAGDGNDNVTVLGSASNATIYGGAGTNRITNKSVNNIGISGFGDADNCSAVVINPSASKTVTINGVSYSLVNQSSYRTSVVLYNYNSVSGETSFWGSCVDVQGKTDNIAYNVVVSGAYNKCYGGELDDKLTAKGWVVNLYGKSGNDTLIQNSYWARTYGGNGDDTIIANRSDSFIYGEAGNDTITINVSTSNEIDGGTGDDTYNINASCAPKDTDGNNIYNIDANDCNITGGMGNDTFYVNGNNNIVNGAGGDDYFVINSKGANTIDGATGDNYYVDNSDGNAVLVNVVSDPNSGMLQFSSIGEEKSFIIDGKKYTIKNSTTLGTSQAVNSLKYSYNATTGKITVDGSNFTITSDDSACNLAVKGDNNLVYGSKYADTIIVESGSNNKIYGLNGDDNLILNSANNSVLGGEGNDTITVNAASGKEINGEDGNDIININCNNNSNIMAGDGNDKLNINGSNNVVDAGNGNNNITISESNNTVTAADGSNDIRVTGSSNNVTAGSGNNKIGISGDDNTLNVDKAVGEINILGNSNEVTVNNGANKTIIRGSHNTYISLNGEKNVSVKGSYNEINTGSSSDVFNISGDFNYINSTGGDNSAIISGDSNIYEGGSAKDTIRVNSGNSNNIDGGAGNNTLYDKGINTIYTNVRRIITSPFETDLKIDIGSGDDKFIHITIDFSTIGFTVDLSTAKSALESLEAIDDMLKTVSEQLLNIGSTINRLESVAEAQALKLNNLISFRSTMQDADIAEESSNYIRYQILQQASSTLLASSRNLKAQNVLGLLSNIS